MFLVPSTLLPVCLKMLPIPQTPPYKKSFLPISLHVERSRTALGLPQSGSFFSWLPVTLSLSLPHKLGS